MLLALLHGGSDVNDQPRGDSRILDMDSAWIRALSLSGLNKENRFDSDVDFSSVSYFHHLSSLVNW